MLTVTIRLGDEDYVDLDQQDDDNVVLTVGTEDNDASVTLTGEDICHLRRALGALVGADD